MKLSDEMKKQADQIQKAALGTKSIWPEIRLLREGAIEIDRLDAFKTATIDLFRDCLHLGLTEELKDKVRRHITK